jgi:putative copper export protein
MPLGYHLLHEANVVVRSSEIIFEWLGFVVTFIMLGAAGFYFAVLRRVRDLGTDLRRAMAAKTARLGAWAVVGKIVIVLASVGAAYATAPLEKREVILHRLGAPLSVVMFLSLIAAVIAYGVAAMLNGPRHAGVAEVGNHATGLSAETASSAPAHDSWAWELAAFAVTLAVLRSLFLRRWVALINPLHEFAGGLWLGTLFVLVIVGIGIVMHRDNTDESRGKIVASLVNAFSPFALCSAALLVVMGVLTAIRHLKRFDALWTTPYGMVFVVKLLFVLLVIALGAWNWRRVRPRLGDVSVAQEIRRSATRELTVAAIVLIVTAILVSLPVPR